MTNNATDTNARWLGIPGSRRAGNPATLRVSVFLKPKSSLPSLQISNVDEHTSLFMYLKEP